MSLSPTQKLDKVLEYLNKHRGFHAEPTLVDSFTEIDREEVLLILDKLKSDKYVITEPDKTVLVNGLERDRFKISFTEEHFLEYPGGYEMESKFLDAERNLEKYYRQNADDNATRLNRYTLILGIGTVCLVLVELVRFFYELCRQSH